MTERADLPEPSDVDPDVELASALLDEEATPDERARAGDPSVQEHLGALRRTSARVGEVPAVPDGLLDQHVAAALDAFDGTAADARVVPLDSRRRGGRTWWQRAPLGAVAAVVAVVALVGAVGLASMSGDDGDDTATAAFDEPGDGGGDSADDSEAFSATEESADLGAGGSAERALASYADLDELVDDLAARTRLRQGSIDADDDAGVGTAAPTADAGAPAAGTTSEQSERDPCDAVAAADIEPDEVIEIVPALVDGTPVTAVVHGDPEAPRLAVVDDGSCRVLVDRDLPDGD